MRRSIFILIALTFVLNALCQNQQQDKKRGYKVDIPLELLELNNASEIVPSQIWVTRSGFQINHDLLVRTIGAKKYVIITYPEYKQNGHQGNPTFKDRKNSGGPVGSTDSKTKYSDLEGVNGKTLCMPKEFFDTLKAHLIPIFYFWSNITPVGGQLTVPFKLRPKLHTNPFQMTTDVTIGAYVGARFRLSKYYSDYLTIPITAGLTFININDNTTTTTSPTSADSKVVPGFTWSTGLIFQLDKINFGIVFGDDYASQVKAEWIYNKKTWLSFAIGFSFLK